MDSTPSPSSSSAFDLVSSALERYIPRGGAAAAAALADTEGDRTTPRRVPDTPAAGRQEQILGAVGLDRDLIITRCNLDAPVFTGLDAVVGRPFVDLLPPGDVPTVTRRLRQVVETGEAHVARIQRLRRGDGSELVVSMSVLPAAALDEGLTVSLIAMARRLHLYAAETAIGTSLDMRPRSRWRSRCSPGETWPPSTSTSPYGRVRGSPRGRRVPSDCGGRPWCRTGRGPRAT
ncbi:hypothetical protein SAFG77S_04802 [Streptomyces afghaniensis]